MSAFDGGTGGTEEGAWGGQRISDRAAGPQSTAPAATAASTASPAHTTNTAPAPAPATTPSSDRSLPQASHSNPPQRYVVITNISKKNNVRVLINAAATYAFRVLLVGWKDISDLFLDPKLEPLVTELEGLPQLKEFLSARGVPLVGIEIIDGARCVLTDPFERSVAVMPGNEGTGLSRRQKEACDYFVSIPQYGSGTASLNVHIATTLVLHRYHLWAQRQQP
ncbi:hypothetical protein B484DRAFT_453274 [Ochromonadaceae sp. CCMP2298]|nr:hypothetical protein B484DRAFT_453274 [Ochromonadaceae sp. CCMP2298]